MTEGQNQITEQERWQQQNREYLAAALTWLHLRLRRLGGGPEPAAAAVPAVATGGPAEVKRRSLFPPRRAALTAPDTPALPAPSRAVTDAQIAEAAARVAAAAADMDPAPALVVLGELLGLSTFEQEVLLLCMAIELDGQTARLCAEAQRDGSEGYATYSLAMQLFDDPHWEALSPGRPLRAYRLIDIHQPGPQSLMTSPLRCDERIVAYANGVNDLDSRLAPLVTPLPGVNPGDLASSQKRAVEAAVQGLMDADWHGAHLPVVQLLGADTTAKELAAGLSSQALGRHLYRLPAELLPTQAAELETVARLWEREALLLPVALYLDAQEEGGTPAADGQATPVQRFLGRMHGIVFLATREPWPSLRQMALNIDVARPTPAEQQAGWAQALGQGDPEAEDTAGRMAAQFNLNLPAIRHVVASVPTAEPGGEAARRERLWQACILRSRPRLDMLAQRLEALATWEDIVLPPSELELLRQIAGQVGHRGHVYDAWGFRQKMNRGLGISALFAGPSGTGKTMAAEVIANELHLDLYRIDLSAVVSKYIGETEKNLRRVFDAAEYGAAILLFDEADALFGKRSEVKDSHDRYANIEINYLLQRMEAYRGLAILATNMKTALDTAFMRRLRFVVNFPFPGTAQRREIWEKVFPAQTPRKDLDPDRLARLNLTGGNIHSVALNAAFLAAQRGMPVTMAVVMEAARSEYRKLDKALNEADFRLPAEANGARVEVP